MLRIMIEVNVSIERPVLAGTVEIYIECIIVKIGFLSYINTSYVYNIYYFRNSSSISCI
jgi:hypothetical protein